MNIVATKAYRHNCEKLSFMQRVASANVLTMLLDVVRNKTSENANNQSNMDCASLRSRSEVGGRVV